VTDRRTDGQTDRQTEFSSLDRVCIACSAVKMILNSEPDILAYYLEFLFLSYRKQLSNRECCSDVEFTDYTHYIRVFILN